MLFRSQGSIALDPTIPAQSIVVDPRDRSATVLQYFRPPQVTGRVGRIVFLKDLGGLRSRTTDGSPLTVADLPPPGNQRWVIRRKAEVVAAVRGGLLSLEEACDRYVLTVEEYLSWQRSIDRHGLAGLRTTRIQDYRAKIGRAHV